jgi:hypothetical protein
MTDQARIAELEAQIAQQREQIATLPSERSTRSASASQDAGAHERERRENL